MLGVSERRACKALGHPRTTQRYETEPVKNEQALTEEIVELTSRYGRYGYRKDHRPAEASWLGREPQACGEDLAAGRAEGASKAAQERAAVAG